MENKSKKYSCANKNTIRKHFPLATCTTQRKESEIFSCRGYFLFLLPFLFSLFRYKNCTVITDHFSLSWSEGQEKEFFALFQTLDRSCNIWSFLLFVPLLREKKPLVTSKEPLKCKFKLRAHTQKNEALKKKRKKLQLVSLLGRKSKQLFFFLLCKLKLSLKAESY